MDLSIIIWHSLSKAVHTPIMQGLNNKTSKITILWLLLLIAFDFKGQQATFIHASDSLGVEQTFSETPLYASGLSVRDFDQDGWDDISVCVDESSPVVYYKNFYGTFKEVTLFTGPITHDNYVAWIDYDNDGLLDCFEVADTSGVRLLKQDSNGVFTDVTIAVGLDNLNGVDREGALFADFNNDGLLDLFVSVYSFQTTNSLFFQTAAHTFTDVSNISGACDSLDRTFHAIAIDYNNDGWMDFYEANDFYDGTMFYKNNGDSTFTEVSYLNGTYQELDAMGLGVGDFDGDLDLDIHITDRYEQSRLLRNNNDGTFSEVGVAHNLNYEDGFGWGNNFFDADLDGDNDIYISGMRVPILNGKPSLLYINDGSGYFSADTLDGDSLYSFSNAVMDLNNDRLPDLVSLNSEGNPTSVWLNTLATSVPRFSLKLQGCSSNRDAIGAKIIAYDGTEKRIWMVHSTQSYCSQNSDKQIIPILNNTLLDSLRVIWPLGNDTILYNIEPNQTILLEECGIASPYAVITVDDYPNHEMVLCTGASIILRLDGEYDNIIWSTGATSDSIVVTTPGTYNVTVTNQWGNSGPSTHAVTIDAKQTPIFSGSITPSLCFNNGSITITPNPATAQYNYSWSNGATSTTIDQLTPGSYTITVDNDGFCEVISSYFVPGPDSLEPIVPTIDFQSIACHGDSTTVTVSAIGGTGTLQFSWSNGGNGSVQTLNAGIYTITITDSGNCAVDTSFFIGHPNVLFVWAEALPDTNYAGVGKAWVEIDGGVAPYVTYWNDSLEQIGDTAYNLKSGKYQAHVIDANGCDYLRNVDVKNRFIQSTTDAPNENRVHCSNWSGQIKLTGLSDHSIISKMIVTDVLGRNIPFQVTSNGDEALINTFSKGLVIISANDHLLCKTIVK